MKKITLLFTVLIVATYSWQAQAQFPEGFETAVPPTGWVSFIGTNGEGVTQNWETSTTVNTGTQAAFVRYESVATSAEDWLVTPQFTPTVATPILTFMQRQDFGADWGTTYTVRVSTASQTTHADFTIVDTQVETDFNSIYNAHNVDLSAYNGTPIYVAFVMEQNDGDSWYIDDVDLISNASPPNCADTPSPVDMATNVAGGTATLSWTPSATGDPATSYEVFWGTTSGALTSLGSISATTVDITNVGFSTTYYWSIVPSNVGGPATGCPEWSFTTGTPPVGTLCTDAIVVGALPYNTTDDTANYGDDYSGSPGATGCGTTNSYLNGDDVVYEYTATADGSINIAMTAIGATYSGIFVYTDCADIGTTCANGVANSGSTDRVFDLAVTNGTTYYIVISTWATPQSTTYTLDITENTCTNATATYSIVDDCANSGGFFIDVDITDLGSATSLSVFDGTTTMVVNATGVVQFGDYANATDVTITVTNDQDNSCQLSSGVMTQTVCPPANDTLAGATPIVPSAVGTGCATFNFTDSAAADGTTDSGLDSSCNTTDTGLDRFYSWTATTDGLIWNDGDGNPGIVIRTLAGVEVTCEGTFANDDTVLSGWNIGDDLIIQIYDFGTADVATSFCLEEYTLLPPPPVPANDDCANATNISSLPFTLSEDASGATNNGGFVSCDGAAVMNDGVWYTFTPTVDGTVSVAITNVGSWDPEVRIFSGSCGTFTCVANADSGTSGGDETLTDIAVVSGTQYWINVAYWSGTSDSAEGTFDIAVTGAILSVEDNTIEGFSIYPNPVNDVLSFRALDNIENISIYNLLGQEVMRTQPNELNAQIDMSNLTTGMYVVKVQIGNQLGAYRIMKK
ncbi:MAG: hypothetical protein COB73_06330 [Flavobacteriaceae bacterium]|nr:MAG: hypothetical protein COB73_06330 [Flavobacteriaceae bacterium]